MQMAEARARRWEKEVRVEYQNGTVTHQQKARDPPQETDFVAFVNDVWFPIHVKANSQAEDGTVL